MSRRSQRLAARRHNTTLVPILVAAGGLALVLLALWAVLGGRSGGRDGDRNAGQVAGRDG